MVTAQQKLAALPPSEQRAVADLVNQFLVKQKQ